MFNVAIDGPAGAGKSTIAKMVAKKMNLLYVDTGSMYRAMALSCLRNNVSATNHEKVAENIKDLSITLEYDNGVQQVILNGENINAYIRTEEVSNMTSIIATYPEVREKLVSLQREIALKMDVIMDGRDIGTHVLKDAPIKIYLTASANKRAMRRYLELKEKGMDCNLEMIEKDIIDRDYRDMNREISPLSMAEDAVLVDSSDMGIEETVEYISDIIKKKSINVKVAKSAGFCFGVKRAVETVYKTIEENTDEQIYTYGPIIHNEEVVKDLETKGVKVINTPEELMDIKSGVVIIRSHGVEENIYNILSERRVKIVDATCPFVRKIHKIVKEKTSEGYKIIIIGNKEHPEVIGIKGWGFDNISIINSVEEAEEYKAQNGDKICIVAQTTFNCNKFNKLVEIITKKGYDIIVVNTICNATSVRQTEAAQLAKEADAMIVIGGKHSSNTQKLYEICKEECKNTYYIQTIEDLDKLQLETFDCVGITAGASTPNNIIEEVQTNVRFKF